MSSRARSTSGPAPSRRARAAALALVVIAALAAAGGCGSDGGEATGEPGGDEVIDISGTEAVGEETAGSVAQLVECRDWNGATTEQKLATIEDVRSQVSREDTGISAPALTDAEALEIFDGSCEPSWAQGFRLYKIYARAASFAPLARELREP